MRILITGATGGIGGNIITALAGSGVSVRATSRDPSRARVPAGVEVMAADLNAPASLAPALAGVDALFVYAQGGDLDGLARVVRESGVTKVVVLSTIDAGSDRPYAQYNRQRHVAVEEAMASTGARLVCLRPGAFARNALRFWGHAIREAAPVRLPFPESQQSPIDERDLGAVAVRALISDVLDGERVVVTGPESLTQRRQLALIGAALGRPIVVETAPEAEARAALAQLVPPAYVELLMAQWQDEVGEPSTVTDAVPRVLGRPATSYAEWARRNVELFRR